MKKHTIKLTLSILTIGFSTIIYGQVDPKILNWYNGGGAGMQTEKAYKKLEGKKSSTVIVAVIDSGVDIEHEDLQGKIWVNPNEIGGNGIDDDKNGYVDDIHGWNFLGNSAGENVEQANLEKTRILRDLSAKFKGVDPATISANDRREYDLFLEVKADVESELANYSQYLPQLDMLPIMIKQVPLMVADKLKKENYTSDDLNKWNPSTDEDKQVKQIAGAILITH